MEPAGSMGVWNLDDYQFVAFIWGAAQLGDKARIKPKSIPDPEIAEMLSKENQFFACLAYIHKVKSGPGDVKLSEETCQMSICSEKTIGFSLIWSDLSLCLNDFYISMFLESSKVKLFDALMFISSNFLYDNINSLWDLFI